MQLTSFSDHYRRYNHRSHILNILNAPDSSKRSHLFEVETQWRLGLKVKLDSSLPSLITNPIIYILHMLPGHYLFKLFTTSIIFYPHNLRLCVCVHIYIIWRERERERERDQTITTEYMNAINIHVCARSYV